MTSAMTTANKVTILRILLVPLFISQVLYFGNDGGELHRWLAVSAFALCAVSDGVDGYIARRYNQRSELGALLDPLADKLLLVSGIVLLSFNYRPHLEQLPLWLVTTIVGRDVLLVAGSAVIHHVCGRLTVQPRSLGKIATVLQMATVLWVLLKWSPPPLHWLALTAAVCTGVSGLLYYWDGFKQLSASPHSAATQVAAVAAPPAGQADAPDLRRAGP
jgi:CDP-diacylglycerol--glycerol-3-phosphate 3-phosphatidyltransferase